MSYFSRGRMLCAGQVLHTVGLKPASSEYATKSGELGVQGRPRSSTTHPWGELLAGASGDLFHRGSPCGAVGSW